MCNNELLKNKIVSAIIVLLGLVSLALTFDATAFVMLFIFAGPLFFAKENWIK